MTEFPSNNIGILKKEQNNYNNTSSYCLLRAFDVPKTVLFASVISFNNHYSNSTN